MYRGLGLYNTASVIHCNLSEHSVKRSDLPLTRELLNKEDELHSAQHRTTYNHRKIALTLTRKKHTTSLHRCP